MLVDLVAPAADHAIFRVFGEKRDLPGESLRHADVVGVHPGDERRAGGVEQLVETGDEAAVFAEDRADARIEHGIAFDDRAGGIARPVVEYEELEIVEALAQDALDGLGNEALAVIDAHGDTDRR